MGCTIRQQWSGVKNLVCNPEMQVAVATIASRDSQILRPGTIVAVLPDPLVGLRMTDFYV